MKKKALAYLLLVCMLLSCLAGCGDRTGPDASDPVKAGDIDLSAGPESDDPSKNPLGRYEETVKFTTVRNMVLGANFPQGMSITENPYVDAAREKLNVEMEVLWQNNDYAQKLDMNIISGELPDVFWVDNYITYQQLLRNDMLEPLTEAYRNCAGTYMREVYDSYGDGIFEAYYQNGELMALPSTRNTYQHAVLWVRQDWLDKLGMETPKTREEIAAVAKAFMDKDPGGNGAGKTIGMAVQSTPVGNYGHGFGVEALFSSFGAFPKQWVYDDEGKVVYGSITQEAKEGLAFVTDLYAQGIIDPQFMIRDYSDVVGMVSSGRCGLFFFPWSLPYSAADFVVNNPQGEWTVVEAPLAEDGKFHYAANRMDNGILCVRKGYEHPEVVVKLLNLEFDMYRGFDQEGYAALQPLFDAGTTWTAPMLTGEFNLEYNDAVVRIGSLVKDYIEKGIAPAGTTQYNIQLAEKAKSYFDAPSATDAEGWVAYVSRYVASNALGQGVEEPVAFHYSTNTMSLKWSNLEKLEEEFFLQVMVGERSIDGFDDFVSQWRRLGGDEITAEVQAYVDQRN